MSPILCSVFRTASFALLLAAPALRAQTIAPPPPVKPAAPAEEPLELSPFVVATERDTGWSANDTLSATRTRQALKDVPVNIDAITADFMEDLGLFSADEVTKFVANVYAAPAMENDNNTDNFSFRGLSQRFNVSRNYFRWYVPSDTYNVERIDFGKGSNSLIFGDVEPGGQGSVFTKRALFKNFGTLLAQYGSEDAYRVQLDVNRQLTKKIAFRFNIVRRADKTFQDFSRYGFKGETGTVTWRPFKSTEIRVEFEQGDIRNQRGYAGVQIREQSARSLALSGTGWYVTSDATNNFFAQSTLSAVDRSTANNHAGGSPSLVEGGFFDVTMRNAAGAVVGTKRVNAYPKNYNIRGSFDGYGRPFTSFSFTIEQRFGDLGLEFAFNRQNQEGLRNDNYFSNIISLDVNGRPYTDSVGIDLKRFGNDVDAYRFTAAYPWQITNWMKQLFIVSGDYREDFTNNFRWFLYNLAGVNNGGRVNTTNDRVRFRAYLDDPLFYSKAFFDKFTLDALPKSATFQPGMFAVQAGASAADATEYRQQSAVGVSASGNYFKGRLQSLVGVRWDWNKTLDFVGTERDARGEDLPAAHPKDAPSGDYLRNPNLDLSNKSYTGGLTLKLTPDINAYGVYSESFRFQDARTFDRKPFGPISGTTKELGLKGDFWGNKASFTLGFFNIDRANVEFRWNPSSFSAADVENLFNPNNLTLGSPGYLKPWDDVNQYRDILSTETSKGFDLTLFLRPAKGLQTRFTLAKADVITRPDFSSFRAYLDAAIARGNESPALIAEAQDVLNSSDFSTKPTGARASPWSASWVIDYGFPREAWLPLRGVKVGVNGNWRDNYLLAIVNGQEFYGGTTHLVNAYVMRDQKIWKQQVRFRLGCRNIVDLENGNTRRTGTTTLANGTTLYRLVYVMPPQWDLTATVRF
ncbi:MAG: TonB-dependent receptor plug domain-containing protein [Verrucomicrobia bacterium]|nr:TonB-dependent receptor plug domain-containing protein [Verrucomicrobiota bacterium]